MGYRFGSRPLVRFSIVLKRNMFSGHNVFSIKAVSYGAKNDADNSSVSQLIVDDMYDETFTNWGHYVISFDIKTGTVHTCLEV